MKSIIDKICYNIEEPLFKQFRFVKLRTFKYSSTMIYRRDKSSLSDHMFSLKTYPSLEYYDKIYNFNRIENLIITIEINVEQL